MWQPWATLVVKGHKCIETRDYPPPLTIQGQRVAVYATKTRLELHNCDHWPFSLYLTEENDCPLGCIVGTVVIDSCLQVDHDGRRDISEIERAFGDYRIGRWAWGLIDPVEFTTPIPRSPAWGRGQGIFHVPDEVIANAG